MTTQFLQFVINHWMLWLLLVVAVALLFIEETRGRIKGVQKLSATDCVSFINRQDALVIDIRNADAFNDGHIANARNMPSEKFTTDISIQDANPSRPLIVVCQAGQSSLTIGAKLRKQGFLQVYSLAGGINGWKQNNFPLVKGTS